MHNPFRVVEMFEQDLCEYTGARYAVAVNSCTAALELALQRCFNAGEVSIPRRTYPSVPQAAIKAGLDPVFVDLDWKGEYQLTPTNVFDSAKRLRRDMYRPGMVQCLSFHPQKPLALSVGGGAILHDNADADKWYRRMRFDGRTEGVPTKDDNYEMLGNHCYMMPGTAAEGIHRLSIYAATDPHDDMPSDLDKYPDLSKYPLFH